MTATHALLIFVAGMAAGTINTVVGSGSLITFPMLISLGYAPVIANVSNNVGLAPGALSGVYGYRRELRGQMRRIVRLVPASMLGGGMGAVLLLAFPSTVFRRVVFVLVALALVLVLVQPWLARRIRERQVSRGASSERLGAGLFGVVLLTGVYGGYFGAAQGVILISLLGIFVNDELQRLNAVKNVLALTVNTVASIVFIVSTDVDWKVAGLIACGSVIGGQIGSTVGRRLDPKVLRGLIVCVGVIALVRLA